MIDPDARLRCIGTDPSTTNMGVAVIDINMIKAAPFELVHVNTIQGDKVDYHDISNYTSRPATARGYGLAQSYKSLLEIYEPNAAITEDNFLGASADTFKRLVETVDLLRQATHEHHKGMFLANVLPNIAKAVVGANFKGTQKEDVLAGLKAYPRLNLNGVNLDDLTDHAVDSIVICLYLCEDIARGYNILYKPEWRPFTPEPRKKSKKK